MNQKTLRRRRIVGAVFFALFAVLTVYSNEDLWQPVMSAGSAFSDIVQKNEVRNLLEEIPIKGRAPKTAYSRDQFGGGWATKKGCDTRNIILYRDLVDVAVDEGCIVISGALDDPYTGEMIQFRRGASSSAKVQIDHVVALSDAWQKGAQQLTYDERVVFANDPLVLLAVDGPANQEKGDGDSATWLPPNKSFRCQYVARQVAIKAKYDLWVTQAEYDAMIRVLERCPDQLLPTA